MAEAVLEHSPIQEKSSENKYTINDFARDIAKRNPQMYGPGKPGEETLFPIFKEGKFDSNLREDINDENFIRWMRQEISLWYGAQEWENQPTKLSRIFRRIIPPRHKQLSFVNIDSVEDNIDEVMNYVEKNEDNVYNLNVKRLVEAHGEK